MSEPLHVGDEIRLEATPKDKRGWPVYREVTWHSADPGVAVVTPHGTIAGLASGTVRITAALDDARASLVIPVLPPRVVAVDIVDPPTSVVAGRTFVLTATPVDHANNPLPRRAVVWTTERRERRAGDVGGLGGRAPAGRGRADGHLRGCPGLGANRRGRRARRRCRSSPRSVPPRAGGPGAGAGARVLAGLAHRRGRTGVALGPSGDGDGSAVRAAARPGMPRAASVSTRPRSRASPSPPGRPARCVRTARSSSSPRCGTPAARLVPGAAVAWSSGDSAVARVDRSSGQVRGRAFGPGPDRGDARLGTGQRGDHRAPARRARAGGVLDRDRAAAAAPRGRRGEARGRGAGHEGRHAAGRGAHLELEQPAGRDGGGADGGGAGPRARDDSRSWRGAAPPASRRGADGRARRRGRAPDPWRAADGGRGSARPAGTRARSARRRPDRDDGRVDHQRRDGGHRRRDCRHRGGARAGVGPRSRPAREAHPRGSC